MNQANQDIFIHIIIINKNLIIVIDISDSIDIMIDIKLTFFL